MTLPRGQKSDYEFSLVKEEVDGQTVPVGGKDQHVDDYMYMKVISNLASMWLNALWKLFVRISLKLALLVMIYVY